MSLTDSNSVIDPIVRNVTTEKIFSTKDFEGSHFGCPKKYRLHVSFSPNIQYENIISYKAYNSMNNYDNYDYPPKPGNNKCFSCGCTIT